MLNATTVAYFSHGQARLIHVRYRRISTAGSILVDKTVEVEGPGRRFLQPLVTFSEEGNTAYLVTMSEDARVTPSCTIVAVRIDEVVFTTGAPECLARDCSEASSWKTIVGRALQERDT